LALIEEKLTGAVIAAATEVHRRLGPGFMESVYEEALKMELAKRGIAFESQRRIEVLYDGKAVGVHVLDLMVEGKIIVELKAVEVLQRVHYAQLRSYLRAAGLKVGLLPNFNSSMLAIKRIVN